jgi:transposase
MEEKEEFILHFKSGKYTVSALAQMFEISRPTAYKFIHRYESAGLPGLLELSRRPRRNPNKTPDRIEQEIIRLRDRHPRWGAPKLAVLLEDRFPGIALPAVSTISAILKRQGLVKDRRRRKRVEPSYPIFDPLVPNEVWSADFKGKFRMGNKKYCQHRTKIADLTLSNGYERWAADIPIYPGETVEYAVAYDPEGYPTIWDNNFGQNYKYSY